MQYYSKKTREGGKVLGILGCFYFSVAGGWSVFPKEYYFVSHTSHRAKMNTDIFYHYFVFLISIENMETVLFIKEAIASPWKPRHVIEISPRTELL